MISLKIRTVFIGAVALVANAAISPAALAADPLKLETVDVQTL